MKNFILLFCIGITSILFCENTFADRIVVPRGIDHSAYNNLLIKYIDKLGLVDYLKWKKLEQRYACVIRLPLSIL